MVNEARISARCITLVERMLKEKRNVLNWLEANGENSSLFQYEIARMEYALGERETPPVSKEIYKRGEF